MASINQNTAADALPNFCNLGVVLRVLVATNAFALAGAIIRHPGVMEMAVDFVEQLAIIEPVLMLSLVCLCPMRRPLAHLGYGPGVVVVIVFEIFLASMAWLFGGLFSGDANRDLGLLMR